MRENEKEIRKLKIKANEKQKEEGEKEGRVVADKRKRTE